MVRYLRAFVVVMTLTSGFKLQASEENICFLISNSKILAQDSQNTYLGSIENSFSSESIFNTYGTYGNEFSGKSIWNQFGTFGNEYNQYSPFNTYSNKPPIIVKDGKIIGYLSSNESIKPSISPNLLKALCKEKF